MNKENFLLIWDAGHGIDTPGKRSPVWSDGTQLREYEFTREVVAIAMGMAGQKGLRSMNLVPEARDICLQSRCDRANRIMKTRPNSILISVHGNAAGVSSARGFECFSSPGLTESDRINEYIIDRVAEWGGFKMRLVRGEEMRNKEERFKILTGTVGNAVLVEMGFYTNEEECKFMMSLEGRNIIAGLIVEGLENYINSKIGK